MTPFKVKDIVNKYLKVVDHPKGRDFDGVMSYGLEIEWATIGTIVDYGFFAMQHMETWFGVTQEKWYSGFQLTQKVTR
ncbi:hypothetical protein Hanom_Chr06g00491901 [Helianthus anomalus]